MVTTSAQLLNCFLRVVSEGIKHTYLLILMSRDKYTKDYMDKK